jgi:hypothetical protein
MSMPCFIDTMRPITPAETAAWKLFLTLPRSQWTAAKKMFRLIHTGTSPDEAMLGFVSDTGITDPAVLAELEKVVRDLAEEEKERARQIVKRP